MIIKMKETLDYWNERAKEQLDPRAITHYDVHQREFEIETIKKFLNKDQRVLDLGCGNGFTTCKINHLVKEIVGIDFSPEMIERAKRENDIDGSNIKFIVGDARNLNLDEKFDVIITQRCFINILDWEKQQESLKTVSSLLKEGGLYLMFEGCSNRKRSLNDVRKLHGLDIVPPVEYNLDFEEDKLKPFMGDMLTLEDEISFGNYEYITRVIYPKSIHPESPKYGSVFHEIALKSAMEEKDFYPSISKLMLWVWKK